MGNDQDEAQPKDDQKPAEPDKDVDPFKVVLVQDGITPEKFRNRQILKESTEGGKKKK